VATAPAPITNGQRQASPTMATAAVEITMISIVAQPRFWAMFNTVGMTDPRRPTRPRSETMAGAPVLTPNRAEAPSSTEPRAQPTTMARIDSPTEPTVVAINAPVRGPNSEMPRLAHKANWSVNRSGRGGSVVRVSGASRFDRAGARGESSGSGGAEESAAAERLEVTDTTDSLRRHYPVRFGRSADPPGLEGPVHSALSAHHLV
jgi:hypothetical protein